MTDLATTLGWPRSPRVTARLCCVATVRGAQRLPETRRSTISRASSSRSSTATACLRAAGCERLPDTSTILSSVRRRLVCGPRRAPTPRRSGAISPRGRLLTWEPGRPASNLVGVSPCAGRGAGRSSSRPGLRVRRGPALRRGRRPGVAASRRGLAGALRPQGRRCPLRAARPTTRAGTPFSVRHLRRAARHQASGPARPGGAAPWPALMAALLLSRRTWAAALIASQQSAGLANRVRRLGLPPAWGVRWFAEATYAGLLSVTRYATTFGLPVALAYAGRTRRPTAVALLLLPALDQWRRREITLDPFRWIVLALADDAAYGAGVWWWLHPDGQLPCGHSDDSPRRRLGASRTPHAVRPASVGST